MSGDTGKRANREFLEPVAGTLKTAHEMLLLGTVKETHGRRKEGERMGGGG